MALLTSANFLIYVSQKTSVTRNGDGHGVMYNLKGLRSGAVVMKQCFSHTVKFSAGNYNSAMLFTISRIGKHTLRCLNEDLRCCKACIIRHLLA